MKSDLLKRLQDPFLKSSLDIQIAVFWGIGLLMAAKPKLWQPISIVVCSAVLGLLLQLVARRRRERFPLVLNFRAIRPGHTATIFLPMEYPIST